MSDWQRLGFRIARDQEVDIMMGVGFGGMGWLSMLVFWVVIIALAVWILSKLFPGVTDRPASQPGSRQEDKELS